MHASNLTPYFHSYPDLSILREIHHILRVIRMPMFMSHGVLI